MVIEWCEWPKIINERFNEFRKQVEKIKPRYSILYGGRGSSKSDFTAKYLIWRCLTDSFFRFILIRQNYNTIKDSQYQNLKDTIYDLGLERLFEFKLQPLEIVCINGNSFIARGCDDTSKLKSVKDPTGVWWEEDIPSESDFITVTTSIRTEKAPHLFEIFTINPEVEGDYRENWFWKRFFKPHEGQLSFEGQTSIKIDNTEVVMPYITMHSTHRDNKYLPMQFRAILEDYKNTNPYYYTIYTLGEWGNKIVGGLAYKNFLRGVHTGRTPYNPDLALHISFDFNTKPYMTLTIWQMYNKFLYQVGEICLKSPNNTTLATCKRFAFEYKDHVNGVFVYGDPAGRQEDTRSEVGFNDYRIIFSELEHFRPENRVDEKAPSVSGRLAFINHVLVNQQLGRAYRGITVQMNEDCHRTVTDFLNVKEAPDGTKLKTKVKDKETGETYEPYGHTSDSFDYMFIRLFREDYNFFQRGGELAEPIIGGGESFSY